MLTTKKCTKCHEVKPSEAFYTKVKNGKSYLRSRCKSCFQTGRDFSARNEMLRKQRETGENQAYFVWLDARGTDRKKGLSNDLTREFVEANIKQPCFYCEATDAKMTLDRVSNDLGHLQTNVVPCCYRCNMVRGSMPFDAWQILAPSMKVAREQGLFGDWGSVPIRKR